MAHLKQEVFCNLAIYPKNIKALLLMEQTGYTSDGRSIWPEGIGEYPQEK